MSLIAAMGQQLKKESTVIKCDECGAKLKECGVPYIRCVPYAVRVWHESLGGGVMSDAWTGIRNRDLCEACTRKWIVELVSSPVQRSGYWCCGEKA